MLQGSREYWIQILRPTPFVSDIADERGKQNRRQIKVPLVMEKSKYTEFEFPERIL